MSGPAYKQPQVVPPDLVPSSESLPLASELRGDGGAFVVCPTGPGVSCQAYDKPHVVLTQLAESPSEHPPLDRVEFTVENTQILGLRTRWETSPALVVRVDERILVLRRGWTSEHPNEPWKESPVFHAQQVKADPSRVNERWTDPMILSEPRPLSTKEMKAAALVLPKVNEKATARVDLYWFDKTSREFDAEQVRIEERQELPELPPVVFVKSDVEFLGLVNGMVLLRVEKVGDLALRKEGETILMARVELNVSEGQWSLAKPLSKTRELNPREARCLPEAAGSAARHLFAENQQNGVVR